MAQTPCHITCATRKKILSGSYLAMGGIWHEEYGMIPWYVYLFLEHSRFNTRTTRIRGKGVRGGGGGCEKKK